MEYLKGISTLKIDNKICKGCGMCTNVCPHAVIAMKEKRAFIQALDSCMECGACRMNCPFGAIQVNAGVGCAHAILKGMITGKEPSCGCSCEQSLSDCC